MKLASMTESCHRCLGLNATTLTWRSHLTDSGIWLFFSGLEIVNWRFSYLTCQFQFFKNKFTFFSPFCHLVPSLVLLVSVNSISSSRKSDSSFSGSLHSPCSLSFMMLPCMPLSFLCYHMSWIESHLPCAPPLQKEEFRRDNSQSPSQLWHCVIL